MFKRLVRECTDRHVAREDLGTEGHDAERLSRLAGLMRASRGQFASLAYKTVDKHDEVGEQLERSTTRQLTPDYDLHRGAVWVVSRIAITLDEHALSQLSKRAQAAQEPVARTAARLIRCSYVKRSSEIARKWPSPHRSVTLYRCV